MSSITFNIDDDYVNYSPLYNDRRYEYAPDDDPIWDKAEAWVEVNLIRVDKKGVGKGTKILSEFLKALPPNVGVVLNASPLDGCQMYFYELQAWYIRRGFKQISQSNLSLYHITKG
jgi:hypothetical protein